MRVSKQSQEGFENTEKELKEELTKLPEKENNDEKHVENVFISEQAILGAILKGAREANKALLNDVFQKVRESDFSIEEHKLFFTAFERIYLDKAMPDPSLTLQYIKNKLGKTVEHPKYLFSLEKQALEHINDNFLHHLDIVRNKGSLKDLTKVGEVISYIANSSLSADEAIIKAKEALDSVKREKVSANVIDMNTGLRNFIEVIDQRYKGDRKSEWTTGYKDFDEQCFFEAGNLVVVAGRPAMGKTTLALNFARNMHVHSKVKSLIVSLEMSSQEISEILVSSSGKIELDRLKKGTLQEEDFGKLNLALSVLNESDILISDDSRITPSILRTMVEDAVINKGIKCVVLDYIQLMTVDKPTLSRNNDISEISRELKLLAKEFNIVIIALSQLSRDVEKRVDKRPVMSDLRESGAIEQDADKIIFVYRDEVYNPETDSKNVAELIGRKNRGGSAFTALLSTRLEMASFGDFIVGFNEETY